MRQMPFPGLGILLTLVYRSRVRSRMLTIRQEQIDALSAALNQTYARRLADYLRNAHPDRSRALDGSTIEAVAQRVAAEARRFGVEDGRAIARLATIALLVDADVLSRPEVKALFAFSGISADFKADLLCDQITDRLAAVNANPMG